RAQQQPARLPVGSRARDGTGLPVAELQQRLLALRPAHPGPAGAVAPDGGVVGRVRALPRAGGARPAGLAALRQQAADVAPARRTEPDDLRGHLCRGASVRLLERGLTPRPGSAIMTRALMRSSTYRPHP